MRTAAVKAGFRSGLEHRVWKNLKQRRVKDAAYEAIRINYEIPASNHYYTPDIILPNGIILEVKGRLVKSDRDKHLLIKEHHPNLDIRFVFTNSRSKLRKGAKSSYGQWCDKYGFRYYDRIIPEDWLKEKGKNRHPKFIKFAGSKIRRVK